MHADSPTVEEGNSFFGSTQKIIFAFILIGFCIYFNGLFGQFVWDDQLGIVYVSQIHTIDHIPSFFTSGILNLFYRPIYYTYYTLVQSLFGLNVFGFHLTQLAIHIANSIFIFLLFRKFFAAKLSFSLALLFLIHPLNSEAVVYATAVSDPLYS